MLLFECPSCKTRCQAPDDYAGKAVVCPHCHTTATVPAKAEPMTAVTEALPQVKPTWREEDEVPRDTFSIRKDGGAVRSWIRIGAFTFIGAIIFTGVLTWCLLPAPRHIGASNRTQGINHVKQIVLSVQAFNDTHKRLPFNGTRPAVANDPTSGSWAFQILPFIDQPPVFANPDAAHEISIAVFMCPERQRSTNVKTGSVTDYFINVYLNTKTIGNGWNARDSELKMKDVADGTSNTVFVGQGWLSSGDYRSSVLPGRSNSIFLGGIPDLARGGADVPGVGVGPFAKMQPDSTALPAGAALIPWGGPFKQGVLMGMGDGTVRMFPYEMSGVTFGAFLTPTNREVVELPDR